jgi:hypothetical protein
MIRLNLRRNAIANSLRNGTCLLLAALLAVGSPVMAGEPVAIRSSDVALNAGGLLKGTVLNAEAQPVAGVAVNVLHEDRIVATAISDGQGEFGVKGLRNGAHIVRVGSREQSVRLWSTNTAPPEAVENIAIVVDEEVVRGQMGGFNRSRAGALLLVGGVVAIVLGTTLDNNDSPASP